MGASQHEAGTIVAVRLWKRYPLRVPCLIAVGLLFAVTACSSPPPQQDKTAMTEDNGPVGPVPHGLQRFYSQTLTWQDCQPYATTARTSRLFAGNGLRCARMTVPLDYDKPDGETVTIGLLRHPASGDQADKIGSLLVNPGGPGASGMASAAALTRKINGTRLEKRFDFVGFDPRGVGASEPRVQCLTGTERDAKRASDLETDGTPQGVAKQEAKARAFARKCTERTKYGERMLANVGSKTVARDMDVLRSVLGDRKLSYIGYSYGTRLGYTYAEMFPGNVRALILDGALDPEQNVVESLVAQGKGFGTAFREFAAWCAKRADCPLGADPAGATKAYQRMVRPLIDNPIEVGGRTLSYQNATMGTIQALYSDQLWNVLKRGLAELQRGEGATLLALADMYYQRGPRGKYAGTQDAFTAIHCVDDPRVTDKAKLLRAQRRYEQVAPFLDDGRPDSAARGPCTYWPVPPSSQGHQPDVEQVAPALVISTTNDPATPYEAGVALAEGMDAALLTYKGNQHTVFLQGVKCVDKIGIEYLINGTLPPEGATCSAG